MGQIQTGVGLISGLNISDIVDKLMTINARSRDALKTRNDDLKKEQTAYTELMALLYGVKYISDNLGKADIFGKTTAISSNSSVISVQTTGSPPAGIYQYTALAKAQNQQYLSSGFESLGDTLGTGKISFRFGNNVEHAANLSDINGGAGFTPGKILVTDRSGARVQIDLTAARSLDDVVEAINNNADINVKAKVVGDRIQLTDNTGETVSNLKVQEVSDGATAASLGLAGINAAADTATGQDIIYLSRNTDLNAINDGLGLRNDTILSDIQYKLRDGTQGEIDLSEIQSGSSKVMKEHTLGEIIDKINAAAPGKLKIEISSDGDRLVLTDLTTGSDNFVVSSLHDSKALEDLGLTGASVAGVITGHRIMAGAKTVLLSNLNGGKGLGTLGLIGLTDRNGASANVDLSNAETLEEVINAINSAPAQITAQVNKAGNGIELVDTSGGSSGNLIVTNGDATNTADKLKITVDSAVNNINSGDLHLRTISLNTKLADLNGGEGIAQGMFRITNSTGASGTINVNDSIQTVGDLLKAINLSTVNVLAEINDTGDGIAIHDSNNGAVTLKIQEYGSTTARDLNLLGLAKKVDNAGRTIQTVDGSMTRTIDLSAGSSQVISLNTTLSDLNGGLGVTRGKFRITNSKGVSGIVDLTNNSIQTVNDLLQAINALSINVSATINSTNNGIEIRDSNKGAGKLIIDGQGSTTAKDLNLLGAVKTVDKGGISVQIIDGKPTPYSLESLRDKINQLNAGVTASILSDGSNKPYRLALVSNKTGKTGELVLDTSLADISFDEIARAKDALLALGSTSSTGKNVLVSSHTNSFTNILAGATITIEDASSQPVTIKVTTSNIDVSANIQTFVDYYNKFRNKLKEDTTYDSINDQKSVLTGDYAALQLDTDMADLVSGSYLGAGNIQSLAQVGVSFNEDGTLSLDQSKLDDAIASNRDDVQKFFTAADNGFSARFSKVIQSLAGPDESLLELRNKSLQDTIDHNQTRMDDMDTQLDAQKTRLLTQFYNMELSLAKLQSNLKALDSIQWMLNSNSNNSLFSSSSSQ